TLIDETRRVLRPGGIAIHGVETGWKDYFNCDPTDPDDAMRKYVWADGHIGVEPPDETIERFARRFAIRRAMPMVLPFHQLPNMLEWGNFSKASKDIYGNFADHPQRELLANAVVRALYDFCFERLHRSAINPVSSRLYLRDDAGNEIELQHGNFTMISMIKLADDTRVWH